MLALRRTSLPDAAAEYLRAVTQRISEPAPSARQDVADKAWANKSRVRFAEVRSTLGQMCSGIERCMYCEDSEWTDVDHFCPKSVDPLRAFEWSNYLAACAGCNSNYKRSEFPVDDDGEPLLIDPTSEDPAEHLVFSPSTGLYVALPASAKADVSIAVFGINRDSLATGRRDAWRLLQLAVIAYDRALSAGDAEEAERFRSIIGRQPFAGVLQALVRTGDGDAALGVSEDFRDAYTRRPEIRDWPQTIFSRAITSND